MKPRNLLIAVVLFMAGSLSSESFAQENIKALIKKCENMDVIDANIVRNKSAGYTTSSSQTTASTSPRISRGLTTSPRTIVNITLKYTPSLEKELVAAFRKDQEKSIHEVEQRKEGKVTHMLYRFDDSEYSFTIKNDTINICATEGGALWTTSEALMNRLAKLRGPIVVRDTIFPDGKKSQSWSTTVTLNSDNNVTTFNSDNKRGLDSLIRRYYEKLYRLEEELLNKK